MLGFVKLGSREIIKPLKRDIQEACPDYSILIEVGADPLGGV